MRRSTYWMARASPVSRASPLPQGKQLACDRYSLRESAAQRAGSSPTGITPVLEFLGDGCCYRDRASAGSSCKAGALVGTVQFVHYM